MKIAIKKRNKRTKKSRLRGRRTCGYGARKKHKKSGHKGGKGMSGSGKRGDQKKTKILKIFKKRKKGKRKKGKRVSYFGKKGITSRSTVRKKSNVINLEQIERNFDSFIRKGIAKKTSDGKTTEINLLKYKILGGKEIKNKDKFNNIVIKALSCSKSAKQKIEQAGGKIILKSVKKEGKNIKKEEA